MTPEQAAHDTAEIVVSVAGRFMSDPACYARGAELGFDGMDFYFVGRAGALGDVPADVAAAALVFFSPEVVRRSWDQAGTVMPRRQAAEAFAGWAHEWAEDHLPDGVDYEQLAVLLERVVLAAPLAGVPLFAAWRTLPVSDRPRARTVHHLNALRELRGGLHAAAVLTVGLTPLEAISVKTPKMVKAFGWDTEALDPKPFAERWHLAEARTDRMFGRRLAVLDTTEIDVYVELMAGLRP